MTRVSWDTMDHRQKWQGEMQSLQLCLQDAKLTQYDDALRQKYTRHIGPIFLESGSLRSWARSVVCDWSRCLSRPITRLKSRSTAQRIQPTQGSAVLTRLLSLLNKDGRVILFDDSTAHEEAYSQKHPVGIEALENIAIISLKVLITSITVVKLFVFSLKILK